MATRGFDEEDDELEALMLPGGERKALRRLIVDTYIGKDSDNPSITTRLDRMERSLGLITRLLWIVTSALGVEIAKDFVKILQQHT